MNPVTKQNQKETYIKCKKCNTEVFTITNGRLIPCKCGAISVDGSKDLVRVLGNPEDYEENPSIQMQTTRRSSQG